ncbi:unnamed protein product [Blepharisma stoltei]|uniref:Uncharacterized protein n=1 Tax=Blepharisma stoltei TaxID=1481888 RepID=A0AAU9IHE7_9CILI|nr:unnamed protein product [Blepharisma stoltei]
MDDPNHAALVEASNSSEHMTIIDAYMPYESIESEYQQAIDGNNLTPRNSTKPTRKSDLVSLWITKDSYNQFCSKRNTIRQEKGNNTTEKNDKCSCVTF